MNSRDDFSAPIKRQLAARVAHKCSNPSCRAATSGPQLDEPGSVNLGVAAHITAASSKGPRFDSSLTTEERCGSKNGIWLCQICGKLIDSDVNRFTARMLRKWKDQAENAAMEEMGRISVVQSQCPQADRASVIKRNLELRDALHKALLKPTALQRPEAITHPYEKFQHSRVIIRSLDDSSYPSGDESPVISGWFRTRLYDFYNNGIEIVLHMGYAILNDEGGWRPVDHKEIFDKKSFTRIKVLSIGRIPYELISAYDINGDEYFNEPHFYCSFAINGEPYEKITYRALGGDAGYDWPLDESRRLLDMG